MQVSCRNSFLALCSFSMISMLAVRLTGCRTWPTECPARPPHPDGGSVRQDVESAADHADRPLRHRRSRQQRDRHGFCRTDFQYKTVLGALANERRPYRLVAICRLPDSLSRTPCARATPMDPMFMNSNDALLLVDVQRDFCPGGTLPVEGGADVVPVLNRWIDAARQCGARIVVSRDWHPPVQRPAGREGAAGDATSRRVCGQDGRDPFLTRSRPRS